jgi:hypothetical protein
LFGAPVPEQGPGLFCSLGAPVPADPTAVLAVDVHDFPPPTSIDGRGKQIASGSTGYNHDDHCLRCRSHVPAVHDAGTWLASPGYEAGRVRS